MPGAGLWPAPVAKPTPSSPGAGGFTSSLDLDAVTNLHHQITIYAADIHQLIELENQSPGRGHARENYLTYIKIDETTLSLLQAKDLSLQSVLPQGETLYLKPTASLSSGGSASDVTAKPSRSSSGSRPTCKV